MLSTSIGKLHRWAKGDDPTGGMSVQWDEKTKTFVTNPNKVLAARSRDWSNIWECHDQVARGRTCRAIKKSARRSFR